MSYSGAGPTGQAFGYPGQNGEQMYGDQSGFQQFHQQSFQQQQQPSPSMGMQQQQQQRGSFSGGMNQAQFFQNQPAYQGQYGQPQQYAQHQQQQQPSPYQQHQQIPQQRQSPQIQQQPQQQHNQMQFNGMQSYQQYQPQGYAQPMQPAANQYTPPSNVWQQQVQQQMHPMPSQQLHQMQNHSMQQQHHQNQHQPSPTPPPPTHQQLQHHQPHLQQQQAQRVFYQSASPSPQLQQRQSHSPAPRTPSFTNLQQLQHARPHAPSPPQPQARVMHQSPQPQQIARRPSQPQVKLEPQPSPQQRPKPKLPQQPQRRPSQPKQQPQPSPQPQYQPQPSPQVQHQPPPPPPPQPEPEPQIQLPLQHQPPPQEQEELPPPPPPQIPTPTHIDPSQLRHQSEDNDDRLLHDQLQQEQFSFVNLQDIQNLPPPPSLSMDNSFSIDPRDLSLPNTSVELQPALDIKPMKEEPDVGMMNAPPAPNHTPMAAPKFDTQRIKTEQQNASFTKSPSITARSPSISSITKRSPSMTPKPRPVNTVPIMAAIAEECLTKARKSAHDVAMSSDESALDEYQALVTTSLSCYEAILRDKTLSPREEALTRLRYATVVQEETENWMEAETALTKGVTLCDKHRLLDLKYCMQYAMLKVLFQRNHKAALKAADGHISDCEAYRHVHWYYAFRLLKAQFYNEMSRESDSHGADRGALENLRAIQKIAEVRGDHAMTILASLLEGLILLKSDKDEKQPEKVQSCLAQVAKFQLDDSVQIIQLQVLYHILDFASSLNIDTPDGTAQKLRQLQKSVDDCDNWGSVNADFRVPVKKQSSSSKTISADTAGIIIAGEEQSPNDFVTMTFMTKMELRALVFTFSGLAAMHKPSQATRSPDLLKEALKILETWDAATQGTSYGPPLPLAQAMKQRSWRTDGQVYLCSVLALLAASHCHWKTAREYMDKILELISPETPPGLRLLSYYLAGAYLQGTGQLPDAMEIFQSKCFALDSTNGACFQAGFGEVALLAGLNRLWIMQHQSCRNDYETTELVEELSSHCNNHWNKDLRTAWHNVVAALVTDPPQQLNQQKVHIHAAMGGSRETSNVLGAAITLCIMRSRFFENVIGDQALKSARAASKQAQRSGNMLWQSVADGMLAHSYEVQSQRHESHQEMEKATAEAKRAFTHDT